MDMSSAQSKAQDYIARWGQSLTITRPGSLGVPAAKQQISGMPQPLLQQEMERMEQEGGLNADAPYPTWFVFAAGADVQENDLIAYDGFEYRVVHLPMRSVGGTPLFMKAVGVREQAL